MNEINSKIPGTRNESTDLLQLVSFMIGNEEYAVDILFVQEINRMIQITKVPNSPTFIEGVINLRGRIIPVVDLRVRLGINKIEYGRKTRIIVVKINEMIIGFIVDSVSEVLRIPNSITEPPPSMVAGIDAEYITAIGKLKEKLLILLDLEKLLVKKDKEQLLHISSN